MRLTTLTKVPKSPRSDLCDTYDGTIVDTDSRHYKNALAASIRPYKQPYPPITQDELEQLVYDHGVHWHIPDVDIDNRLLLKLDIRLSDLRVLQCIADGVKYNNYSVTSYKDVMEQYGMSKSQVFKSLARLRELNLINEISKELIQVRPRIAWCGDWGLRYSEEGRWVFKKSTDPDFLLSEEYRKLVRRNLCEINSSSG